jgi:tetratricopeptide (TPR) repeat protein
MFRGWMGAAAFAAALAAAILLSNRPVAGADGVPLINNVDHYNQVVRQTDEMVRQRFATADAGGELTDEDRAQLREAAKLFDAMNYFMPRKIGPYLGAGKSYALVGDDVTAESRLQQLLNNVPLYENNAEGIRAAMEAKFVLSQIRFRQGKFQEAFALADEAVKAHPDIPNYLIARANAEVELRRIDDAKNDVGQALLIDPQHTQGRRLAKLLLATETGSPAPKPGSTPKPKK